MNNACVSAGIALVVRVEIAESRVEKFLEAMAIDVEGSRKEPGCLGFEFLRDKENPLAFSFFEMYKDEDAVIEHKQTPHYKAWADFKAEGGVLSQTVSRYDVVM